MQKTKKHFLSTLIALLVVITIIPSMAFTSPAKADITDVDIYGNYIIDIIDEFAYDGWDEFEDDRQVAWPSYTFIFVDMQLLEFGFLGYLCNAIGVMHTDEGLSTLYQAGYSIYVEENAAVFRDITLEAYQLCHPEDSLTADLDTVIDFSINANFNALATYVEYTSMCAFGIWAFDSIMLEFFKDVQGLYDGDFPVYLIERDPIITGPDPLIVKAYNSLTGTFGLPVGGGGIVG